MKHIRLMSVITAILVAQFVSSTVRSESIDEIIVTAQKHTETIQNVPATITAFTAERIAQAGLHDVDDLQFQVPNLMFGAEAGLTKITLRGVGLNTSTGEIEGGVAVSVDGVYQPHPASGDQGQLDLERIEVLRGPQGTLYGRNATGGAINFITAAPSSTLEGNASMEYANYDTIRATGKLTGPLSDHARASFAAEYFNQNDGFVKNVNGGPDLDASRKVSGRFKLAVDLSSDLALDLSLYGFNQVGRQPYDVAAYPAAPELTAVEPRLANATYTFEPWRTTDNSPSQLDRTNYMAAVNLTWHLGNSVFTSKSSYQAVDENYIIDADGASANYDNFLRRDHLKNFIEELNLSGTYGKVDLLGGLYFMHEDFDLYAAIRFPEGAYFGLPPGFELPFGYVLRANSYAGYFDGTFHLTDRLRLIGGARYTYDDRTADQDLFGGACVASTKVTGGKLTGRGVIQFDLTNAQNVYASVSTGYRNGGVAYSECQSIYQPETITSYEVGYKARFGHGLTFNTSAFYYDYSNLQLNQVRTTNGQLVVTLVNVPKAYIDGLEFETVMQPNEHWRADVSGSYLDARYGTFYNIDSQYPDKNLGLQNLTGNQLNYAPKYSGTAGIEYTSEPLGGKGTLTGRVEYYVSSQYFLREFNTPAYTQGGYAIGSAYLTWKATERYSARLYVKNLADRAIVRSLIAQDLVGTNLITFNEPRQFGASVNFKF